MNYLQLIPLYITFFMIMTSLFNQDVKAFFWLLCAMVGVGFAHLVHEVAMKERVVNTAAATFTQLSPALDWPNRYAKLSLSSFFIMFTLMYLTIPMQKNKDWNFFVILGFCILYIVDIFSKQMKTTLGVFIGSVMGAIYGLLCYFLAQTIGGDSLVYFNVISSNNVYCSRPQKQKFKCYVYKNGQIISTV